jgi:hypothetical protein
MEWEEVINEAEKWERWLLDNCKDLADEMRGKIYCLSHSI